MGVRGISWLIKRFNSKQYKCIVMNGRLYVSTDVLIDATSIIIQSHKDSVTSFEIKFDEIARRTNELINSLKRTVLFASKNVMNETMLSFKLFYDYRLPDNININNVLFYDYIPNYVDFSINEQLKSTPYVDTTKPYDNIDEIKQNIVCKFEIDNVYNKSDNLITNYAPVTSLSLNNRDVIECLNIGWMRYLILRGGKQKTRSERRDDGNCLSIDKAEEKDIDKSILQYSFYMLPDILTNVDVPAFGCNLEADFAIAKFIRLRLKNVYPLICSNDSDLLVLLNDVNCVVRMLREDIEYFINPVLFWKYIFRCVLPYEVIIILNVLKGTDYNRFSSKSPIHINQYEDILRILNIRKFSDITTDMLIDYIKSVFENNPQSVEVKETCLALNIYLQYMSFENCFKEIIKRKMDITPIKKVFQIKYNDNASE
jgi:hypothetical protein